MLKLNYIKEATKSLSIGKIEVLFSFGISAILTLGFILITHNDIDTVHINGLFVAYFFAGITLWIISLYCLTIIKRFSLTKQKESRPIVTSSFSNQKLWIFTSSFIFLCYLPFIIAGLSVLTPDSWNSIEQITGTAELSNAHPIIFTAFAGIFIHLGLLLGSFELGLILFSIAQSAILAMIFAYVIVWMRKKNLSKSLIIGTFFFYALLPINAVAGIIMWKDILFAGFGLVFLIFLYKLMLHGSAFFTKKNILLFLLFAFLFCSWRNNGLYAYILSIGLLYVFDFRAVFKKEYLLLFITPIIMVAIYTFSFSFISKPTSQSEAMSVPLQQIARTVKYHGASLTEEQRSIINEVLPYDELSKNYNPGLSDPIKSTFNNTVFNENKGKYIQLWFNLLGQHTKTYIAAFLYNTYGYTYPFYESPTTTDILPDNASHFNAKDGYSDSAYLRGSKLVADAYRDLIMSIAPLLRNIGFYTITLIIAAYVAIVRKKRELAGVFIVLGCLFITTILGPVNGEFRYLYLFVIATPFVIGAAFSGVVFNKRKV